MNKGKIIQYILYAVGTLILCFGFVLNTKTNLGIAPIMSVSYSISKVWDISLGNANLILYIFFIMIQIAIHLLKNISIQEKVKVILEDCLQIPWSFVLAELMNFYDQGITAALKNCLWKHTLLFDVTIILIAVICTGIGVGLTLSMHLITNPSDSLVQCISEILRKDTGKVKNTFDLSCICSSLLITKLSNKPTVIGIGTFITAIGVGRVLYLYHIFIENKIKQLITE